MDFFFNLFDLDCVVDNTLDIPGYYLMDYDEVDSCYFLADLVTYPLLPEE